MNFFILQHSSVICVKNFYYIMVGIIYLIKWKFKIILSKNYFELYILTGFYLFPEQKQKKDYHGNILWKVMFGFYANFVY